MRRGRRCGPALLVVPAFVALASLLAGCGETTDSAPSPEVVATAESVSREVTFEAPARGPGAIDAEPGASVLLRGRLFGRGGTGVILAHMRPADQTSWFPFATKLAASGGYTVLTFDFRGYGDSTGDKEFDQVDTDLDAAFRYLRDELGLTRIFLVGASMGGTASLVVAARRNVAGVVSISSPSEFQTMDALAAVPEIDAPKLFISSEDDVPARRSQEALWSASAEPRVMYTYAGDAHGTNIFDTPDGADLEQRIVAFLASN